MTLEVQIVKAEPNFPEKLNMKETELFSQNSFENLFHEAVLAHIPYYSIAIVKNSSGRFKIYDGRSWSAQELVQRQPNDPETRDPETRLPIENVYYCAIPCFQLREGLPHSVELKEQTFKKLIDKKKTPCIYSENESLILDSLNYEAPIEQVAKVQFIRGNKLQKQKRTQEAAIHFWCAASRGHKEAKRSFDHSKSS